LTVGLISSNWGGTPVEAWSSPDALSKCKTELEDSPIMSQVGGPGAPSVLWNAMINPLLNMTIKGAIWYQGEANAGKLGIGRGAGLGLSSGTLGWVRC
jgi:sialate O-acetylesterase